MTLAVRLDYEYLLTETLGRISNSALGLLVRGMAWSAKNDRDFIPLGVFSAFADSDDPTKEIAELLAAEVIANHPRVKNRYIIAGDAWRVQLSTRKHIPRPVRRAVFDRDGYRCVACSSIDDLTIDHIHPVSKGGGEEESNLQTLCQPCNSKKRDRV